MNGVVKRVFQDKGFGFIIGDDNVERFFHMSNSPDFSRLREGDKVSFDHEDSNKGKGPRAVRVESV